jgi:AAA domain/UvrD-like helicase C-terminal domain
VIAGASPTARLLVTAGAGTGKTHVLIERLHRLAENYDLNLADDVLVVSFSRAAVGEIRRRMRAQDGAAAYGTVMTFDSFASRLLARHAQAQALEGQDFDARIEAARRLIGTSEDARAEIQRLQHVIVDEVQDLVGVRRELVQAILEHAESGFTLFGDPAQGIYNFQADDPAERQLGSLVFFEWVARLPGPPVERPELTKNFRYQTPEAHSAEWAGQLLNGDDPDYREILDKLEEGLYDLEAIGDLDRLVEELCEHTGQDDGSIGILCRFNFEVLRVSQKLAAAGVAHHYQRPASDNAVPAWVARLIGPCDSARLGRRAFDKLTAAVDDVPPNAWTLLRRFDPRGSRDMLDLQKIQERIRLGDIPTELAQPTDLRIVVSTIHRAKGLEFDRVVLFEPDRATGDAEEIEIGESARQLYVARTRARRRYGLLNRGPREYARKDGNPGDVWTVLGFAGPRRYVKELEIKGNHSWAQDPAGGFGFEGDALDLQRYIEAEVDALDPLRLRRTAVWVSGLGDGFYYVIEHNGHDVGVADIGWIIEALLRPRYERNWPTSIDGLFVETVDTVAGTSAAGTRAGLSSSGLWLRVRPYGLGRLLWEDND